MGEEKRERHQALLWPRYIEKSFTERTLAYVDGNSLVVESGLVLVFATFTEFVSLIFQHNLLTFVKSLASFAFLSELVKFAKVFCQKTGVPIAARMRGKKNSTRWLVQLTSWDYPAPTPEVLVELRATYEHCQVGTPNTPGALGQALLRKCWLEEYGQDWRKHRHQRPPAVVCQVLGEQGTGARSETLTPGVEYDVVNELDEKNAYADKFTRVPTGRCYRAMRVEPTEMATYFGECTVEISERLLYGCFPVRTDVGPFYPTAPGMYTAWLWREEIELARMEGCRVTFQHGWSWARFTEEPRVWVEKMNRLRDTAPTPGVAAHIKHAIVAAIGRFGMKPETYGLVPGSERGPGDLPIADDGIVYDWWIHKEIEYAPQTLEHWLQYTLMMCRLSLYHQAIKWMRQEMLIATNTDAVYVKEEADVSDYPEKASGQAPGTWRKTMLHRFRSDKPRHIRSQEKTTLPGVAREARTKRPREKV